MNSMIVKSLDGFILFEVKRERPEVSVAPQTPLVLDLADFECNVLIFVCL